VFLLDSIAAHGRTEYPREACGILTGPQGQAGPLRRPDRFVPIVNRHPEPEKFFDMDHTGIINAYRVMDEIRHDPVVIYHTHPRTAAEPSLTDIQNAWNLEAIYIICSFAKSATQPTFRAWRIVDMGIDGKSNRVAEEVAMDIVDDYHADSPVHGLVEGNRVRIIWDSEAGRRTTVATVGPRHEEGVTIYPVRPGPQGNVIHISLDRIRMVGVLAEGSNAAKTRAQAASYLAEAAMRLAAADPSGAQDAIRRAGLLCPRIIPPPLPVPRAYRPLRRSER
jgi:proteasome lid subunit RPN8/RPN11